MPYASASDVAAVNKARVLGVGTNPTASDVTTYISMIGGEIDAILTNKGYTVPVSVASYPEAAAFLQGINIKGAVWMCEQAVPTNPEARDRAKQAYDAAMKMLSDAQFVFDLPMNQARSEPRGPWATLTPTGQVYDPMDADLGINSDTNNPANPFFSRQMQF